MDRSLARLGLVSVTCRLALGAHETYPTPVSLPERELTLPVAVGWVVQKMCRMGGFRFMYRLFVGAWRQVERCRGQETRGWGASAQRTPKLKGGCILLGRITHSCSLQYQTVRIFGGCSWFVEDAAECPESSGEDLSHVRSRKCPRENQR